jgi:hypothetical protein
VSDEEEAVVVVVGSNNTEADETSSLLSNDSAPGDVSLLEEGHLHSHGADITGLALLPTLDFWLLFILLGILTGVGLMTINNIGNDVSWNCKNNTQGVTGCLGERGY